MFTLVDLATIGDLANIEAVLSTRLARCRSWKMTITRLTIAFLDAKRNAIFIGGTGTDKTHLCIGVASAVICARAGSSIRRPSPPVITQIQLPAQGPAATSRQLAKGLSRIKRSYGLCPSWRPLSIPAGKKRPPEEEIGRRFRLGRLSDPSRTIDSEP